MCTHKQAIACFSRHKEDILHVLVLVASFPFSRFPRHREFEEAVEKVGRLEQGVSARELLKVAPLQTHAW